MNVVRNIKLPTVKCLIPIKQYNKYERLFLFLPISDCIAYVLQPHSWSLTSPTPITQASRSPLCSWFSVLCACLSSSIPQFQPQAPCLSCKPQKLPGIWDVLSGPRPRVATFSGCRCSHCGRQRQAGTPHRTGQKPPGRRGRWVGSSVKKRLKHPISLEPQSFPTLKGPTPLYLKSQLPHTYPAGQFKLVQFFWRETERHVAQAFD